MSLVKSPTLTPATLAANARQSTGPNTPAGKRRIAIKGLKRGRHCEGLRENLVKADADAEFFDWIPSRIFDGFQPLSVLERWLAERLVREVWCRAWRAPEAYRVPRQAGFERLAGMLRASVWCLVWTPWRLGGPETKPRYSLKSTDSSVTSPSRIHIVDPRNGRRLISRRAQSLATPAGTLCSQTYAHDRSWNVSFSGSGLWKPMSSDPAACLFPIAGPGLGKGLARLGDN